MNRAMPMLLGLLLWLPAAGRLWAQDHAALASLIEERKAMQDRYKRLNAAIQDLQDAQAALQKRLQDVEDQIHRMQGQNQQVSTQLDQFVSRSEFDKLAQAVKDLDHKRQEDKKVILKELNNLLKLAATPVAPPVPAVKPPDHSQASTDSALGYFYTVRAHDTLMGIITAYNKRFEEEGKHPITLEQLLADPANQGLKPDLIQPGQKIWVPEPKQ